MPENALRTMFIDGIETALRTARSAGALDHPGLVGNAREIVVEKLLAPALPPQVRVGTGKLTDSTGSLSGQIDLILYSPEILPPGLYDQKNGVFPVESALYTVEVKSLLDRQEVTRAVMNARSIMRLKMLPTEHWQAGKQVEVGPTAWPISALFALSTDLGGGGKSELDRYREIDTNANDTPAVKVICVCGRGYWYFETGKGWKFTSATAVHDEVLNFLGGLTNTMPKLLSVKGRPLFGHYLSGGGRFEDV